MIEIVEYLQHFQRPVEIFKENVNTGLAGLTIRGLLNAYFANQVGRKLISTYKSIKLLILLPVCELEAKAVVFYLYAN